MKFAPPALVLVGLAFSPLTTAFWRMECRERSGIGQIDPLMAFGTVSPHTHVIHGGKNFNFDSTTASLLASDCTSCAVTQDKSAYWTPPLMFMDDNGTTSMVNQVGGMLAYYLLYGDDIQAFPTGFAMISGDTYQRNFSNLPVPDPPKSDWPNPGIQSDLALRARGFNCLNYPKNPPEGSLYRHFLPDKAFLDANCPDGLRLEMMFPSCWNGKDVDSPDHKSHVAFPNQVMTGDCPKGFETRLPSLFYETIFDTAQFKDQSGKFVITNGDPTGYGYHGDFIMGWDEDFLQAAVNTCTNPSGKIQDCHMFDIQDNSKAAQCNFDMPKQIKAVDYQGPREGLPGNVQIQPGPAYANPEGETGAAPAPVQSPASSTSAPVPTLSYASVSTTMTDQYGGGVSAQTPTSSSSSSSSSNSSSDSLSVTSSVDLSSTAAASPIATSIYTANGIVVNEIVMQEEVTVTATTVVTTTAATQPSKRAEHVAHFLKHRHNRLRRSQGWF